MLHRNMSSSVIRREFHRSGHTPRHHNIFYLDPFGPINVGSSNILCRGSSFCSLFLFLYLKVIITLQEFTWIAANSIVANIQIYIIYIYILGLILYYIYIILINLIYIILCNILLYIILYYILHINITYIILFNVILTYIIYYYILLYYIIYYIINYRLLQYIIYYIIIYIYILFYQIILQECDANLSASTATIRSVVTEQYAIMLLLLHECRGARVVASHLIQLVVLSVLDIEEYWVSPRKDMDQSNVRLQLRVHRTPSTCTTLTAGSPLIFLYIFFIRLLPSNCNIYYIFTIIS